jgi:hypothetical protein
MLQRRRNCAPLMCFFMISFVILAVAARAQTSNQTVHLAKPPAPELTDIPTSCIQGDASSCKAEATQVGNTCNPNPVTPSEVEDALVCRRMAQCYNNAALAIQNHIAACPAGFHPQPFAPPGSPHFGCFDFSACAIPNRVFLGTTPLPPGRNARVIWWRMDPTLLDKWVSNGEQNSTLTPPPGAESLALLGGRRAAGQSGVDAYDPDQHQNLWSCATDVPLSGGHFQPVSGKLIGKKCNISWNGSWGITDSFYLATISPAGKGHWGSLGEYGSKLEDAVRTPGIDGKQGAVVCLAYFSTQKGGLDRAWAAVSGGNIVEDHGNHLGHLVNDKCHFEWDAHDVEGQGMVYVFYLTPNPPPPPPAVACVGGHGPGCHGAPPSNFYTTALYWNNTPWPLDVWTVTTAPNQVQPCSAGVKIHTMEINEVWPFTAVEGQWVWVQFFKPGEAGACDGNLKQAENHVNGGHFKSIQSVPTPLQ